MEGENQVEKIWDLYVSKWGLKLRAAEIMGRKEVANNRFLRETNRKESGKTQSTELGKPRGDKVGKKGKQCERHQIVQKERWRQNP